MIDKSNIRNRRQVLRLIRNKGGISRAEISKLTGLTRPTVSMIVRELSDENFITETGKGESSGGKRPIMLTLRDDRLYAVGIDLADEFSIRGVLCGIDGHIVRRVEFGYENNFENILQTTAMLIESLNEGLGAGQVRGICIAASGLIDFVNNEILHSHNFDTAGRNLTGLLQNRFNIPVLLENRPNAAAFAEKQLGCGKKFKHLVYMTSGRGVGAGIICDGKIFRGSSGAAGEIGRMRISLEPEPEYQGESRHLEDLSRDSTLIAMVGAAKGRTVNYSDVLELYRQGDVDVVRIFRKNAQFLAGALQIVANVLNPEAIILGGRASELGERYLKDFKEEFYRGSSEISTRTQVFYSEFGRGGVALGGAMMIVDQILNLNL